MAAKKPKQTAPTLGPPQCGERWLDLEDFDCELAKGHEGEHWGHYSIMKDGIVIREGEMTWKSGAELK